MPNESAEEKLLKMMKRSASSVAVKPSQPAALKNKFKFSFNINVLNIFLFIGIVICALGLVLELCSGSSLLKSPVRFPREAKTDASISGASLPSVPSADYYLQKINERNIFKPYVAKVSKSAAAEGLSQQMSKYKLVGIAWLDLPESASVMVKDSLKNKIFFLKAGEELDGITVKTIYTDRAVFSRDNEETTIKL